MKSYKLRLPRFFLFNAAAAVAGLVTLGWIVRDAVAPDTLPSCAARYTQAMVFGLTRDGEPLGAADLQARLAGRDWGLSENASVVPVSGGPSGHALRVSLPKDSSAAAAGSGTRSGMGFLWTPDQVRDATAACLTYSVRLPADFEYGSGGALPGLFGGDDPDHVGSGAGFSMRSRWRDGGKAELKLVTGGDADGRVLGIDKPRALLGRDRWVRIDQEIVLNTPGAADGLVRVFIDGELKLEAGKLAVRAGRAGFAGVAADLHYSRNDLTWAPSPRSASVLLSPLELRWR